MMPADQSPFDETVAAVIAAIGDGLNVLITGSPGAGQGAFTDALVAELSFDRRVVRIVGTQSWRRKAFAALSVLKPARQSDLAADYRARPPRRLRYTELLVDATGATGVLVVERPELLDAESAGVIATVSRLARVPVVAVSRHESPHRASAVFLNDLAPGLRLALAPLTLEQVHALTQLLLGAPVEGETVARIAAQSAGLYDLIVGMTTVGRRTGALVADRGRWRVADELVTADLAGWIEQLGAGITERQRDILRRMAAAAALGEEHVVAPDEFGDLGTLMDIGLVKERGGRLALFPPLIADYVQSQRQVVQRDAVSLSAATSGDLRSALVLTMGRLDAGADAALSHSIRHHGLAAVEKARSAWLADPTAAHAGPLLVALQTTGADPAEIERVIDETRSAPETVEYALLRVWWATYLGLTLARLDEGMASLDSLEQSAPMWRALVTATRAHLRIASGTDARPSADEGGQSALAVGDDLGLGRSVELDRLLIGGRSRSVLERAAESRANVHPVFATALELTTQAAMVFEGRVRESVELSRAGMIDAEEKLNLGLVYAHAYVKMLGLFISGRVKDGHRVLNRVLTLGTARALHEPYQVGILDLGVIIESLRAEPARAAVLAETVVGITGVDAHRGGLPGMSGFSAQRVHAPRDLAGRLWSTAQYCAETGQLVTAVFAGLASLGPRFVRTHAQQIREWAASTESPLLQTMGRYAVLLDRKSPEKLLAIADEFLDLEAGLYFGRARVQAARAHYEHGEHEKGFRLATETWGLTGFMGPERAGLFAELWAQIGLSEREAQVAQAAESPTSREIATGLHLSQRTVENYMYSAYRKAGSLSRESLAAACNSWLRAPLPAIT